VIWFIALPESHVKLSTRVARCYT